MELELVSVFDAVMLDVDVIEMVLGCSHASSSDAMRRYSACALQQRTRKRGAPRDHSSEAVQARQQRGLTAATKVVALTLAVDAMLALAGPASEAVAVSLELCAHWTRTGEDPEETRNGGSRQTGSQFRCAQE
jgi:hypothetical protein